MKQFGDLVDGQSSLEAMRKKLDDTRSDCEHSEHGCDVGSGSTRFDFNIFDDQPMPVSGWGRPKRTKEMALSRSSMPGTPQSVVSSEKSQSVKSESATSKVRDASKPEEQSSLTHPTTPKHRTTNGGSHGGTSPGTLPTPPSAQRPSKLPKRQSELVLKAETALEKNQKALTNEQMWNMKIRKRSVDSAVKSLSGLASQLLTVCAPEADDVRQRLITWCAEVEPRFETISAFRNSPLSLTEDLPADYLQVLLNMDIGLLSSLVLHVGAEVLKSVQSEPMQKVMQTCKVFFSLLSCSTEDSPLNVSVLLQNAAKKSGADKNAAIIVSSFQSQLMGMWFDKLSKQKPVERFKVMAGSVTALCLSC